MFIPPEAAKIGTGLIKREPEAGIPMNMSRYDASGIVLTRPITLINRAVTGMIYPENSPEIMTGSVTATTGGFTSSERTIMQLT